MNPSSTVFHCHYDVGEVPSGDQSEQLVVELMEQPTTNFAMNVYAAALEDSTDVGTVTEVSGLGDEAFVLDEPIAIDSRIWKQLLVREKNILFWVHTSIEDNDEPLCAGNNAELEQMAQLVVSTLRS